MEAVGGDNALAPPVTAGSEQHGKGEDPEQHRRAQDRDFRGLAVRARNRFCEREAEHDSDPHDCANANERIPSKAPVAPSGLHAGLRD